MAIIDDVAKTRSTLKDRAGAPYPLGGDRGGRRNPGRCRYRVQRRETPEGCSATEVEREPATPYEDAEWRLPPL